MNKIFNKQNTKKFLPEGYEYNKINFRVKNTDYLVQRAFNELKNNGIISNYDYVEKSIIYETDTNDNIAISRFAIFNDIVYISWIWITEPLRGKGYGKILIEQTINYISNKHDVSKIYVLPKSPTANHIFEKYNFKPSKEITSWKVKTI